MKNLENLGKLILRVSIASFVLVYGIEKITGPEEVEYIAFLLSELSLPGFIAYGVYIGEIVAPLLMIIGWRTKLAAAVVAGNMIVVILIGHTTDYSPFSQFNWSGIELQTLFLLGAISVACLGAGRFALSRNSRWD